MNRWRRPYFVTEENIENLRRFIGRIQHGVFSMAPIMNKVGMSEISRQLLQHMNRTLEGRQGPKYVLYSGHDVTIEMIYVGLAQINSSLALPFVPTFASNLVFELNEEGGSAFVTLYYNGKAVHNQSYSEFSSAFRKLGDMGMTKEEACRADTAYSGFSRKLFLDF